MVLGGKHFSTGDNFRALMGRSWQSGVYRWCLLAHWPLSIISIFGLCLITSEKQPSHHVDCGHQSGNILFRRASWLCCRPQPIKKGRQPLKSIITIKQSHTRRPTRSDTWHCSPSILIPYKWAIYIWNKTTLPWGEGGEVYPLNVGSIHLFLPTWEKELKQRLPTFKFSHQCGQLEQRDGQDEAGYVKLCQLGMKTVVFHHSR